MKSHITVLDYVKLIRYVVFFFAGWMAGSDELEAQSQFIRRGEHALGIAISGVVGHYASGYAISASHSFFGTLDLGVGAGKSYGKPQGYGSIEAWTNWIGCDVALFPLNREKNERKTGIGVHWLFQSGTHVDRIVSRPYARPSDYEQKATQSVYGIMFFNDLNSGPNNFWQLSIAADAGTSNRSSLFGLTVALSLRGDISPGWKFVISPSVGFIAVSNVTSVPIGLALGTIF